MTVVTATLTAGSVTQLCWGAHTHLPGETAGRLEWSVGVQRSLLITLYTVQCTLYSTVKCSTVTAQGAVLKHMPSWQLLELSVLVF